MVDERLSLGSPGADCVRSRRGSLAAPVTPDGVTLKEYIERVFDEKEKALQLAFRAQQEALALASRTLELRLEKLNELRQEVTSDRGNYVTKDQYEARSEAQNQRFQRLENFNSRVVGFGAAIGFVAGVVGGILGKKVGF